MAAENKPVKGILKTSKSFDKDGVSEHERKEMKWDEMNILATYHPADKDYGHQKVDEPLTPYSKLNEGDIEDSDEDKGAFDPSDIADRLNEGADPKVLQEDESSEDDEELTDEEKVKKRAFETKRKLHYNEFYAVKLARQLMDSDDEDTGKDKNENGDSGGDNSQPSSSSSNSGPSSMVE